MAETVLEAIKQGDWEFEPPQVNRDEYESTRALPGSKEKLDLLVERVEGGLPLWHPDDRMSYDDSERALV